MSFMDYLLLRTPTDRMDETKMVTRATPGKVSAGRIVLSFAGILLGIIGSFYVIGFQLTNSPKPPATTSQATSQSPSPSPATAQTAPAEPTLASDLSLRRFAKIALISIVICLLTYQGLYFSLRLYENEPAWLILIISFQYGYFWQSVVSIAV